MTNLLFILFIAYSSIILTINIKSQLVTIVKKINAQVGNEKLALFPPERFG